MAVDANQIITEIKGGTYRPVYFLQGEEAFYIDVISDYIEKNAIDESQKGFNQVVLYGRDIDMDVVLQNARRFPMMSDRQVVIIKEAQDLKDLGKADESKLLIDYVSNPLPSTILVFCHKNKVLDGRKALAKAIDKKATLVTTKKLYDNQVPAWIGDYVKGKGFRIGAKSTALLAESVGSNLAKLSNEIDKMLINFKEKGGEITDDHIQKYIGISKDYNVFELQKALSDKDVVKANRIVNYFEQDPKNNPIIPIVSVLYGFFSKLLVVHHQQDKSDRNIASVLRVNPFFAKDYINAARKYSLSAAINCIRFLKDADLQSKGIKGGAMKDGDILKELVFKLLHV